MKYELYITKSQETLFYEQFSTENELLLKRDEIVALNGVYEEITRNDDSVSIKLEI
jgi:hypothetical protein